MEIVCFPQEINYPERFSQRCCCCKCSDAAEEGTLGLKSPLVTLSRADRRQNEGEKRLCGQE